MAFTEFYVQTTGSNLNAGSTTSNSAVFTHTNGGWDSATGVFQCASGTDLTGIGIGSWASVYLDGATVAVFVGRVTNVVDSTDTITISTTAKSGTAPSTGLSGRSIKIGGAWKGPNGAEGFPFGFVQMTMTDASSNAPRINIKSGTTYSITAGLSHANVGAVRFEGYTTTPGDGGRATIDGGTSGASYVLLNCTSAADNVEIGSLVFQNNGATGSASGLQFMGDESLAFNCVAHDLRGIGFYSNAPANIFRECEAYACNQSNTAIFSAIRMDGANSVAIRCISHDNVGSNAGGFYFTGGAIGIECIADTNGGKGIQIASTTLAMLSRCDSYNNTGDGIDLTSSSAELVLIENCNLVKNGGWGINSSGSSTLRQGYISNCGFGDGTQANTSGTINTIGAVVESGTVTYANDVTPWSAPTTGDFRIALAAAKGAGRGTFVQTAASYTGTVSYPDIGSAQHLETTAGMISSRVQTGY